MAQIKYIKTKKPASEEPAAAAMPANRKSGRNTATKEAAATADDAVKPKANTKVKLTKPAPKTAAAKTAAAKTNGAAKGRPKKVVDADDEAAPKKAATKAKSMSCAFSVVVKIKKMTRQYLRAGDQPTRRVFSSLFGPALSISAIANILL